MKKCSMFASAAVLAGVAGLAQAQLSQSFDDITTLPGLGWFSQNNSSPLGVINYFQGNLTVFAPQATAGYLGVNYNSGGGLATISDWMVTPQLVLENGKQFTFWTRTVDAPFYPDRLQIRMSTAGASTNVGTLATDVGSFTTLLLDINDTYSVTGFPSVWTQYTVTLSGLGAPTNGRIAFRYFVENAGPSGANSDYIGIDEVGYNGNVVTLATGACCLASGQCTPGVTQTSCQSQGGVYQGDNSQCGTCPQPGRCCFVDGSCTVTQAAACTASGGTFGGPGSACGNCPQPTCYESTGQSVAITSTATGGTPGPDGDAPLTVAASATISTLIAKVNAEHTWQGDVRIQIKHPDGTAMDLVTRPGVAPPKLTSTSFGFSTDNYGNPTTGAYMSFIDSASTVYDDAVGFPGPPAGTAVAMDNPTGPYKAHGGSLNSTFGGKNINGTWHFIANDYYPGDEGIIHAVAICIPAAVTAPCYANCDASTTQPCLNVQDFGCFLNKFASNDTYANCDNSTTPPILNVQDFGCFLNKFASGCSSC